MMQGHFSFQMRLSVVFLSLMTLFGISATSSSVLSSYSSALRRYPYLTDAVASYATINWATDRSESSGAIRYGGREPILFLCSYRGLGDGRFFGK